ncbi:unnamed protein product [Caretta caretta]
MKGGQGPFLDHQSPVEMKEPPHDSSPQCTSWGKEGSSDHLTQTRKIFVYMTFVNFHPIIRTGDYVANSSVSDP